MWDIADVLLLLSLPPPHFLLSVYDWWIEAAPTHDPYLSHNSTAASVAQSESVGMFIGLKKYFTTDNKREAYDKTLKINWT